MKKAYKIISIFIIILTIACICTNVFAAIGKFNVKENLGAADSSLEGLGSKILTFITNAGIILAAVMIAVLGVKYMMGSTEEKAEYKKSLLPYFIGAVLIFAAAFIGKLVVNFGQSIK